MIPFQTTPEQLVKLPSIISSMMKSGLESEFYYMAGGIAILDQGVFDLMSSWEESIDPQEKEEIIADIGKLINDYKKFF